MYVIYLNCLSQDPRQEGARSQGAHVLKTDQLIHFFKV